MKTILPPTALSPLRRALPPRFAKRGDSARKRMLSPMAERALDLSMLSIPALLLLRMM